jgi:CRP-like cAMP-binding protein
MRRLSEPQISEFLYSTPLLRDAPKAEVDVLARFVGHEYVAPDHILFRRNEASDSLYLVVEGRIMLKLPNRAGQEFLIGTVEDGELLGELALLEKTRRIVTATAERPTYLLALPRRQTLPVVKNNIDCAVAFARILAGHLRATVENLGSVGMNDAKARLWVRLMALSRRHGRVDAESGRLRIEHHLSQQNLADSIGTTRVMVNRQLSMWQDQALIEYGRGYIEIPDPNALEAHVWTDVESKSMVA